LGVGEGADVAKSGTFPLPPTPSHKGRGSLACKIAVASPSHERRGRLVLRIALCRIEFGQPQPRYFAAKYSYLTATT